MGFEVFWQWISDFFFGISQGVNWLFTPLIWGMSPIGLLSIGGLLIYIGYAVIRWLLV